MVEIACDGLQVSRRYPGGVALRFARVLRYREDKTADEADTIDTVRLLLGPPQAATKLADDAPTRGRGTRLMASRTVGRGSDRGGNDERAQHPADQQRMEQHRAGGAVML